METNYTIKCMDNAIEITWLYQELIKSGKVFSFKDVDAELVKEKIIDIAIEFEEDYGPSDWLGEDYLDTLRNYAVPKLIENFPKN